jgi:4,5:9,10-diseco-3-hydroxy-5,9,17-trioxoandrosta-1(10),2-diene-4-oate hydrolase
MSCRYLTFGHWTQSERPVPEPEGRVIEAAGLRLAYHDLGRGQPLLALHGGGPGASGWNEFEPNVAALSTGRRLLILDLPGYGNSEAVPIHEPRLGFHARVVAGFLDTLGIAAAEVIGVSLGAGIALKLAADHPRRVTRLVAACPPLGGATSIFMPLPLQPMERVVEALRNPTESTLAEAFAGFVEERALLTEDLLMTRLRSARRPEVLAARRASTGGMEDITLELHRVAAPTLVIWGRDDRLTPLDLALTLLFRMPCAELLVLSHCGHWIQHERPSDFNRAITSWLAG